MKKIGKNGGMAGLMAFLMVPLVAAFAEAADKVPGNATTTGSVASAESSARKPAVLSVFTNGVAKGMHAFYTHANFDALMNEKGYLLIYPKDKGVRIGKPLTMGLYAYYTTHVQVGRPMVTFENDKGPLLNPATIELKGKLEDDVDYSIIFTFEKNTIAVRGFGKDPAGLARPTVYRLGVNVPAYTNYPPDFPQAEREAKLRGLSFVTRGGQKKVTYPYANGAVFSAPAERCWIEGPVYGPRKIGFEVKSPDTAPMRPYIYAHSPPYGGYYVFMYKNEIGSKKLAERLLVTIQ